MNKSRLFINQKIDVALASGGVFYPSLIQDLDGNSLSISVPARRGQPLLLREGDAVEVRFAFSDAVYRFSSTVIDRKRSNSVQLVVLARPSTFIRLQRRSFVRFPVALAVTFRILQGSESTGGSTHRGIILDISGGGLQISSRAQVESGTKLQVELALEDGRPEKMMLYGEVVWAADDGTGTRTMRFGVSFRGISEAQRERIISYVFREMRRRPQV